MKKWNQKGFTLAELLIVVAIIAVLVAIAIPVFNNQLEKSREATDAANIREYYAEIATALVTNDLDFSKTTQTLKITGGLDAQVTTALTAAEGTFVVTVSGVTTHQKVAEWQSGAQNIAGATIAADTDMVGATKVNFTFTVKKTTETVAGSTYLSAVNFATS